MLVGPAWSRSDSLRVATLQGLLDLGDQTGAAPPRPHTPGEGDPTGGSSATCPVPEGGRDFGRRHPVKNEVARRRALHQHERPVSEAREGEPLAICPASGHADSAGGLPGGSVPLGAEHAQQFHVGEAGAVQLKLEAFVGCAVIEAPGPLAPQQEADDDHGDAEAERRAPAPSRVRLADADPRRGHRHGYEEHDKRPPVSELSLALHEVTVVREARRRKGWDEDLWTTPRPTASSAAVEPGRARSRS